MSSAVINLGSMAIRQSERNQRLPQSVIGRIGKKNSNCNTAGMIAIGSMVKLSTVAGNFVDILIRFAGVLYCDMPARATGYDAFVKKIFEREKRKFTLKSPIWRLAARKKKFKKFSTVTAHHRG